MSHAASINRGLRVTALRIIAPAVRSVNVDRRPRAIAVDPVVDNLDAARAMMEHLLKLEAEYLPELR